VRRRTAHGGVTRHPHRGWRRPMWSCSRAHREVRVSTRAVGWLDRHGSMEARLAPNETATTRVWWRTSNAALVLMADHELATSTLAVRLAASPTPTCGPPSWPVGNHRGGRSTPGQPAGYGICVDDESHGVGSRRLDDPLRLADGVAGSATRLQERGTLRFEGAAGVFNQMAAPGSDRVGSASLSRTGRHHGSRRPNVDLPWRPFWSASR